jgi:hypothetical protein
MPVPSQGHYGSHSFDFIGLYHFEVIIQIRVITKLTNSEQSYKGKVKTHNYINRQNHGHCYTISPVIHNDSFEKVDFNINLHGLMKILIFFLNFMKILKL